MALSAKKLFKTVLSGSVWIICGLIVVYQSILCVKKYIESPKGTEIFMTDGLNEMFPHFTICPVKKPYQTTESCNRECMRKGDFWFKNGFQDLENFVQPLDFMVKEVQINSLVSNGSEISEFVSLDNTTVWKPLFLNLYHGPCYTMQLNQTKKITTVIISFNNSIKIFPHSPNQIQTLPNPTQHQMLKGNYKYTVKYQLYQMLDNHGEPCNDSVHYSVDKCTQNEAIKESMDNDNIGCTVPFFENKQHVCSNEVKADLALKTYKKYERKRAKACLQPCNYLKAYMIQSFHNEDAKITQVQLKFGDDSIQVTAAYEAYGGLSLFADIGGYVGMFLGLSFSQLSGFTDFIFSKFM